VSNLTEVQSTTGFCGAAKNPLAKHKDILVTSGRKTAWKNISVHSAIHLLVSDHKGPYRWENTQTASIKDWRLINQRFRARWNLREVNYSFIV